MLSLNDLFEKYGADKCMRLHGYATRYEELMAPLREKPVHLVEIGVQHGCSIFSWLEYFGHRETRIVGIDIGPMMETMDPRYTGVVGRQEDLDTWMRVAHMGIAFDFIIDDGSHQPVHQEHSFAYGWPLVKSGGYYIIEDVHPWFDPKHGPMYHDGSKELLWKIAAALNWNGKSYYGRPFPNEYPNDYERSFASVTMARGCVIVKKT